jgi:hypothetical protein
MAVRARRRPLRRGELPYRDDIRRSYPAPRRVDGGRPVPAEG